MILRRYIKSRLSFTNLRLKKMTKQSKKEKKNPTKKDSEKYLRDSKKLVDEIRKFGEWAGQFKKCPNKDIAFIISGAIINKKTKKSDNASIVVANCGIEEKEAFLRAIKMTISDPLSILKEILLGIGN